MAQFTRGHSFGAEDRLTISNLNSLIDSATVSGIESGDFASDFNFMLYQDTDPGLTLARIWYDTTAGAEGLKYSFISPSNASIAGWLHATPRREGYYWTETNVSIGTPLFVGRFSDVETEAALHLYDGLALMKVYHAAGSTDATEANPALVVATESVTGNNPVKCAWAGLVPADTIDSNATLGLSLFIDHHNAPQFSAAGQAGLSFDESLVGHWRLDGASGGTFPDSGPNGFHLWHQGTANPGTASGQVSMAADFDGTTQRLRHVDDDALSLDGSFSASVWVKFDTVSADRIIVAKNNNSDNAREWHLQYRAPPSTDTIALVVFDGTGAPQTNNAAIQLISLGAPTAGTWYNIQWKYDAVAGLLSMRYDGNDWETNASSAGSFNGNAPLTIGRFDDATNWPLDGQVDAFMLWKDRVLSDADFDAVYDAGVAGETPSGILAPSGLERSSVYGTTLHDHVNATSVTNPPGFVLWGNGPLIQDIQQN